LQKTAVLLKFKSTFFLEYGTLTVHFNRDTEVFLKWKYFRTEFGTRIREKCSKSIQAC